MEDGDLYELILHITTESDAYTQLRVVQEKINRHLVHISIGHGWLGLMQRGKKDHHEATRSHRFLEGRFVEPLQYTMSTISWLSLLWN